jgi:prolyl 4-hydroxylase
MDGERNSAPGRGEDHLARARACLATGSPIDIARAIEALNAAIAEGEAQAHCVLAVLLGMGVGAPMNWQAALDHLLAAAKLGEPTARGQLQVLAANEASGRPDADLRLAGPDVWRVLRDRIRVEDWAAPSVKQVLSASPRVVAIEGFLSQPTCDWIIARAAPRLGRAMVYGLNARAAQAASGRTNSAFEFGFLDLDLVLLMVRSRIAATIGVPVGALEPPQVLHYDVGERYARHHDYLDPSIAGHAADIAMHGQRMATVLVYLNAGFDGGETSFPRLDLRRRGSVGDALYFANLYPSGAPDARTLHEGLPPTGGAKWLLSQWVRNRVRI